MAKVIRWGVGALSVVGGLAVVGFIGCGSSDSPAQPADTGPLDTGPTDTPSDAPVKPDRKITIAFGAPDLKPQFICLGAFASEAASNDPDKSPIQALGPLGIPDPSAPDDVSRYSGFPYGIVVPYPVTSDVVRAALGNLYVVGYILDENPYKTFDAGASSCSAAWPTARGRTGRRVAVPAGTVKSGESWAAVVSGCEGTDTATGACGAGANLSFKAVKLDSTNPGSTKMGVQFMNLSLFGGVGEAVPSFQNVEVYLQARGSGGADAGDGGVANIGDPVLIAGDKSGSGVKYLDLVSSAKVIDKIPGDPAEAYLIVTKHGTTACGPPAPALGCIGSVAIPLKAFLGAAARVDSTAKIDNGVVLFMGLAGSPVPKTPGDATTAPLRVLIGNTLF